MRDEVLNDWNDLLLLADRNKREPWLYRGVTRNDFSLTPSIGRPDARGMDLCYSQADEALLLDEFQRMAWPMLDPKPGTQLEVMAVAQHHGLRTRLLDWTESLLVAAMFATERGVTAIRNFQTGEQHDLPPAIYGIRGLETARNDTDPFQMGTVKVYRPAHISPRIAPQQAVFTVHPNPQEPFDHPQLVRWTLAIKVTIDIKLALDAVGISRASLFPGIDGLADALNWRHKWGVLRR